MPQEELSPHHPAESHGQAALLLVESLIHALIERSVLTVAEAVEITDTAHEVERDRHDELAGSPDTVSPTGVLLLAVKRSLELDL